MGLDGVEIANARRLTIEVAFHVCEPVLPILDVILLLALFVVVEAEFELGLVAVLRQFSRDALFLIDEDAGQLIGLGFATRGQASACVIQGFLAAGLKVSVEFLNILDEGGEQLGADVSGNLASSGRGEIFLQQLHGAGFAVTTEGRERRGALAGG